METKNKKNARPGSEKNARSGSGKMAGTRSAKAAGSAKKGAGAQNRQRAAAAQKKQKNAAARQVVEVPDIQKKTGTPIWAEIILWLMLAFCVILFFSNVMGIGGPIGNAVGRFFFGVFGVMGYVLPFLLFILTAFLVANGGSMTAWIKTGAAFLLFVTICAFCELLTNQFDAGRIFSDYYMAGSEMRTGGGFLGGLLCRIFCPIFGQIGAWICLFVLILICAIVLTERSLFDDIRKKSGRAYEHAKTDSSAKRRLHDLKREKNQLRKEQKLQGEIERMRSGAEQPEVRIPRRERKVSGVITDTLIDPSLPAPQEIHEVLPKGRAKIQEKSVEQKGQKEQEEPEQADLHFTIERNGVTQDAGAALPFTVSELEADDAGKKTPDLPDPAVHDLAEDFPSVMPETVPEKPAEPSSGREPEEDAAKAPDENGQTARQIRNPKSSREEQAEAVDSVAAEIAQAQKEEKPAYVFPPLSLLTKPGRAAGNNNSEVRDTAAKLQQTLHNFGVNVTITNVSCGPSVTRYELQPEQGVKVSRIVNLSDDIKLNLAAADIRIEAPIPGKAAVGIEVPNKENNAVLLRELLESEEFRSAKSNLSFAVGKDIAGKVVVADIAKMPHLLIAGATGSGKSVCINTLIMSILYKADPEDVKLIMIDPKVVELSVYNGIPHLFIPVVTDPKKASGALNWAVAEMTDRYQKFASCGVRDLKGYNERIAALADVEDENKPKKLPQIVIIVDELADLMMVAPGEVEDAICRLAQLARAAGIHLIIATQRPSVNVITGLIKANMPSRIAFSVTSGVDSRTIIDMNGAEKLLGKGDMLFYPQGYQKPARVQGAFVSDQEVGNVTDFLTQKNDAAGYRQEMEARISQVQQAASSAPGAGGSSSDLDSNFAEAGRFIIEKDKASIGMLQRVFKIGFNRAARIMDQLAEAGVVGPEEGTKPRKILMTMEEFERFIEETL